MHIIRCILGNKLQKECGMQKIRLSKEEKEIFKVLKNIRQGYTLKDFLKARDKAKKQVRNKKRRTG